MLQLFLQVDEHVERRNLSQIVDGVVAQHFVVEPKIVETNDEIGALQLSEQIVHLLLTIDPVLPTDAAVGNTDAHPHLANLVPPADLISGLLRFQIEIDDVPRNTRRLNRNRRMSAERSRLTCYGSGRADHW